MRGPDAAVRQSAACFYMDDLRPKEMNLGIRLLRLSAVYLATGGFIGMYMGVTKDFLLCSVHTHVALLGWLGLTVAGLVYTALPACGVGLLARIHFWGHNVGLPMMIASLSLYAYGVKGAGPIVGVSSSLVFASLLVFAANVVLNAHLPEKSSVIRLPEEEVN